VEFNCSRFRFITNKKIEVIHTATYSICRYYRYWRLSTSYNYIEVQATAPWLAGFKLIRTLGNGKPQATAQHKYVTNVWYMASSFSEPKPAATGSSELASRQQQTLWLTEEVESLRSIVSRVTGLNIIKMRCNLCTVAQAIKRTTLTYAEHIRRYAHQW
jgi:hypothetical protein